MMTCSLHTAYYYALRDVSWNSAPQSNCQRAKYEVMLLIMTGKQPKLLTPLHYLDTINLSEDLAYIPHYSVQTAVGMKRRKIELKTY